MFCAGAQPAAAAPRDLRAGSTSSTLPMGSTTRIGGMAGGATMGGGGPSADARRSARPQLLAGSAASDAAPRAPGSGGSFIEQGGQSSGGKPGGISSAAGSTSLLGRKRQVTRIYLTAGFPRNFQHCQYAFYCLPSELFNRASWTECCRIVRAEKVTTAR